MSERTLRHWARRGLDARRPGRPSHGPRALWQALWATVRELRKQGYQTGAQSLYRGLGRAVPLRLVRWAAKMLKHRRERRRARRWKAMRQTIRVHRRDTLWSMDATHLGRPNDGKVEGQVLRDVATRRILGVTVGPPVTKQDVLALLEAVKQERGGLPLVLATDNGSPYIAAEVVAYLDLEKVVHLRNVPRTPQHNAWAERTVRELKEDSGLGKGVQVSLSEAAVRFAASCRRLNERRLRPTLGFRTAEDFDRQLPSWYDGTIRDELYYEARRAVESAVRDEPSGRARRKKEREAILATLESVKLIKRTRGEASTRS